MAPIVKRCSYDSETESSSYEDEAEAHYKYEKQTKPNDNHFPYRKAKCSSRNAVIARENRIKKKLYMEKLEQEVKNLRKCTAKYSRIINEQSCKIADLQKQIKYMNNVLVNSGDLRVLMNNIQHKTGMSVATSLDKTLLLNNDCVAKPEILRTTHPWYDEHCKVLEDLEYGSINPVTALLDDEAHPDTLFNFDISDETKTASSDTYIEHSYTFPLHENNLDLNDSGGVCLHVSKHRVSLEFCSTCSENASETWKPLD